MPSQKRSPIPVRLACLALVVVSLATTANGQGFGKIKKKIVLHRKLPHLVHISGTAISIKATARNPQSAAVAQQFSDVLESELLKDDSRLHVEKNKPETLITCTITEFDMKQPVAVAHNPIVQDKKKPSAPTYTYRFNGTLALAYSAKDVRTGKVLDSDNVTAKYNEEFDQSGEASAKSWKDKFKKAADKVGSIVPGHGGGDETPPDATQLQMALVERAVKQIAVRLVNTEEDVDVLLARGKLDDFSKRAENGLWKDMLEGLETMTPFPDREDDSYRLYNIGVAYEALAYGSEDIKVSRKNLEQAAINYGKALDLNPEEKYFLEPQNRIRTDIAYYKRLEEHETVAGKSHRGKESDADHDSHADSRELKASSGDGLTNDGVIKMVKANIDDANIIATIHDAPVVSFDLTADGMVKLADAGVKGPVLTAMRERARRTAPARRRPATTAAAKPAAK